MYDGYLFEGTPIKQMTEEDIKDCLFNGIEITDTDNVLDMSIEEAYNAIKERLEIELTIRAIEKGLV